ncbi:MAG: ATP-binding protein, partial [Caulobacteraceae bacterium]
SAGPRSPSSKAAAPTKAETPTTTAAAAPTTAVRPTDAASSPQSGATAGGAATDKANAPIDGRAGGAAGGLQGGGFGGVTLQPLPLAGPGLGAPFPLPTPDPAVQDAPQASRAVRDLSRAPASDVRAERVSLSQGAADPPAVALPVQAPPVHAPPFAGARTAASAPEWMLPTAPTRGLFGLATAPFVQGDFVAAVRIAPGRWVTVQPLPEPFPNSWQRRVLLWFAISFAMVAPIGYLFARRLAAPLEAFALAAERLGRDPSGAVLTLKGPAEIGRAATAFNLMQQRLKSYIDDRTAMVGAISHDLRTPLARMRFRLERAPAEMKPGMLSDVSQMEAMISSVLLFIRDASEPSLRERVDLRSIVECVVDDAALIGGDAVLDPGPPVSVEVDSLGVQRVVNNLVENALKYGQICRVRLYVEGGEAVAEVADTGPGLPESEMERVFLPFYRSVSARTLDKGGIGLGLAVSRSIARAHGGDVRLRRGEDGLVAQLRLPLAFALPFPARSAYAAKASRTEAMSATTAFQSPGAG